MFGRTFHQNLMPATLPSNVEETTRYGQILGQTVETPPLFAGRSPAQPGTNSFSGFQLDSSTPAAGSCNQLLSAARKEKINDNCCVESKQLHVPSANQVSVTDINVENLFPDLIIVEGGRKPETKSAMLQRNFSNSQYGRLDFLTKYDTPRYVRCSVYNQRKCLAEGTGNFKDDAEIKAACNLIQKLRATNYFIELKQSYFHPKKPTLALNPDANSRDIYKVVCFNDPSKRPFPFTLTGPIDYVTSLPELLQYLEDEAKAESKTDIFVLNIEKPKWSLTKAIAKKYNMKWKQVIGVSNLGVKLLRFPPTPKEILQDLLQCGGENVKYKLRSPTGVVKVEAEEEKSESQAVVGGDNEEIVISPWISENLIIVEYMNENNCLESAKEILFLAVRDSPLFREFIIEKRLDNETSLITGEAMIDRKVVGRAQAYNNYDVNQMAAMDAMDNLRKTCCYIEAKKSYFGCENVYPLFLRGKAPGYQEKRFIIADSKEITTEVHVVKLFNRFWQCGFEDLYFLQDFDVDFKERVFHYAKEKGLFVRWFGNQCLCVYKRKKHKQLFNELMSAPNRENEKYKLTVPLARANPERKKEKEIYQEKEAVKFQGLFDFDSSNMSSDNKGQKSETTNSIHLPNQNTSKQRGEFGERLGQNKAVDSPLNTFIKTENVCEKSTDSVAGSSRQYTETGGRAFSEDKRSTSNIESHGRAPAHEDPFQEIDKKPMEGDKIPLDWNPMFAWRGVTEREENLYTDSRANNQRPFPNRFAPSGKIHFKQENANQNQFSGKGNEDSIESTCSVYEGSNSRMDRRQMSHETRSLGRPSQMNERGEKQSDWNRQSRIDGYGKDNIDRKRPRQMDGERTHLSDRDRLSQMDDRGRNQTDWNRQSQMGNQSERNRQRQMDNQSRNQSDWDRKRQMDDQDRNQSDWDRQREMDQERTSQMDYRGRGQGDWSRQSQVDDRERNQSDRNRSIRLNDGVRSNEMDDWKRNESDRNRSGQGRNPSGSKSSTSTHGSAGDFYGKSQTNQMSDQQPYSRHRYANESEERPNTNMWTTGVKRSYDQRY